jgi:hypothetical protein
VVIQQVIHLDGSQMHRLFAKLIHLGLICSDKSNESGKMDSVKYCYINVQR